MPADFQTKVVTQHFGKDEARTIAGYETLGGYAVAKRALGMAREQILAEVKASNLRGRGGAGFPTGVKWGFVPAGSKDVHLVCNADESEPGTCKDRELLFWDPHRLIEGMIVSAHALGAVHNYIYIRGEMMREVLVLQDAVREAYERGYLGDNIFGTGKACHLTVHRGAGAYICGEETALLNSLEGLRGQPRLKPPFPAVKGLFGNPTVVNNVETLMNVPTIIDKGGAWFAALGPEGGRSGGTRIVCVSGHVEKPGVYELPMTITFNQLIDEVCGGVWKGRKVKAVIPGGSSMPPLTAEELDVPIEFDALMTDERIRPVEVLRGQQFDMGGGRALRTMAGSGGIVVMDDHTDVVKACWRIMKFYAHESCGQCTPCREGTGWLEQICRRVAHGGGKPGDIDLLAQISHGIAGNSICALGEAAAWPMMGFITKFRDEFEAKCASGAAA
ncbi:complex I 51 kDa subunit family protein [Haliangium ochraceum]|uniref:NADH-quinone oxidoreductase, F subunit n=1 Tax=Haliangium ochraceum (strain DSM 14365 / JCM 11303 / SMP-2) TaxID=502025 RepID=D0LZ02_HALO1|nr:NADH-quinone oxidoreductase subunit F [Haliangium ochraceum]ACY14472.1 NADH-quinone oxidoreductase, F subunit [Haliangium ochraceum DSM 14365]